MKNFTYETHWDEIKGQLKQRFAQLTDDDLAFVKGKGEELLARLREKLGLSEEDLDAQLKELQGAARDRFGDAKAKLGTRADDMKTKAGAAAEEVKAQAGAAYDQARERARGYFSDGEEYVRQNPRESLVAAICAGFVAGLLIRR